MHQSILSYKGSRYLWVSLMLCTGAIFAYALDEPSMPANGYCPGLYAGYDCGVADFVINVVWDSQASLQI